MASLSMSTGSSNTRPPDQLLEHEEDRSRIRVAKACTRCRTRKDRCDGLRPSCSACRAAEKQCMYEATTKKRGLPEGYVRSLEKLLTLSSHCVDELEDLFISYLQNEDVKRAWNGQTGDELYTSWKESKLYQELEGFLQSNPTAGAGSKRKRTTEDDLAESPSDHLDTTVQLLREGNHRIVSTRSGVASEGRSHGVLAAAEERAAIRSSSDAFPVNSKELLDSYFTYVHCWFPILDRPSVLKNYYGHLRRGNELTQQPDGSQALLWSVFSYAAAIHPTTSDRTEVVRRYSEIALQHIPTPYTNVADVQDFDHLHASALLILALLRLGNGQWLGSWNCTGRAARIVLALQDEQPLAGSQKQALLQGCLILETLLDVHFHNTRSLFPATLIDKMIDEDGHEEWETWTPAQGQITSTEPSFALSIFNRLTKVFLLLHEALSDSQPTSDPAYIQSKLEEVHILAQEHFAAGLGRPSPLSAPHHVYFQIGLLFAQLRLVSCVPESARAQFDLAPLATNVLGLFEICEKSHAGLARVPPLYADILSLASDVAGQARHVFDTSAASPSFSDFTVAMNHFRSQLCTFWESFRKSEETVSSDGMPMQDFAHPLQMPSNDLLDAQGRALSTSSLMTSSVADNRNLQHAAPLLSPPPAMVPRHSFSQRNWTGFSPTANAGPSNLGVAYPGTSPSFSQGDEVDAIFYEMAHLDTNEWTNERALGLRDFGFSDETAFVDWTNDPERLAVPVDGTNNAPLSSNMQSWTFGMHGS